MRKGFSVSLGCALCVLVAAPAAWATPYASGVSVAGDNVAFILNEDADHVYVEFDGGASTLDLGALAKGTHNFSKTGFATWDINVKKVAAAGWAQFSDDALTQSKYYSPRGVAVNRDPTSQLFGNIYVAEAVGGAVAAGGRTTTDGIYALGADQSDITSQGDSAYAGGVDWTGSSSSPFKIGIGPDGTLYVTDWSDGHSGMWTADPNSLGSAFPSVFDSTSRDASGLSTNAAGDAIHGSIPSGAWVEGTGADRKIYTVDEDVRRGNILRADVGTTTSGYDGAAVDQTTDGGGNILNGLMDLVRAPDGSWYIAQYRFTDSDGVPSLSHWQDGSNAPDWTSGPSTFSLNLAYGSMDIDEAGESLVMGTRGGLIYVVDISGATPSLSTSITHSGGSFVRDVAFDAAGNIYAVSSSTETLRIYTPGGTSHTVTGSDGTFNPVPEPATMVLLGLGGLGALLRKRR